MNICPCGKGKVVKEHDIWIQCEECSKKLGLIPQKGYDRGHWRKIKNEKN